MTSNALTRWLKQGLARGMCPLCRASHKLDREYIWYFLDKWSMHEDHIHAFASARGFCPDHAEQLRRSEVDALQSTLGISDLYLAALMYLDADLAELGDRSDVEDEQLRTAGCPACAYRDEGLTKNAGYLLEMLIEDESFRQELGACGLCVPHFQLAWDIATRPEERERLVRAQRSATSRLIGELAEHIRKQRAEFRDEPVGAEADSWQRAIWLTNGWPAPSQPAGVPETLDARRDAAPAKLLPVGDGR
jgi:Family of unknown function (DUF6062)